MTCTGPLRDILEDAASTLDGFDRYARSPDDTGYVGSPFEAQVHDVLVRARAALQGASR